MDEMRKLAAGPAVQTKLDRIATLPRSSKPLCSRSCTRLIPPPSRGCSMPSRSVIFRDVKALQTEQHMSPERLCPGRRACSYSGPALLPALGVPYIEKVSQWRTASRAAICPNSFCLILGPVLPMRARRAFFWSTAWTLTSAKDKAAHLGDNSFENEQLQNRCRPIPRSWMTLSSPRASTCRG
jgi:hypothetical protein